MANVKRFRTSTKKVVAGKADAKSKSLVKLIRKVASEQVHKQIEDKQQSLDYGLTIFNNAASGSGDQLRVFPLIALGVNSADRNGDTVTVRNFTLMGHIVVNPPIVTADTARMRIMVRMIVLQPKTYGTYTSAAANISWMDTVLRAGNSVQGLDGTIRSMYYPVNYEAFTVFGEKRLILQSDAFISSTSIPQSRFAVEMFKMNMKLKNHKVKYNDTGSEPIGFCPILLLGYSFLDGTGPNIASTSLSMSFNTTVKYEDA